MSWLLSLDVVTQLSLVFNHLEILCVLSTLYLKELEINY
jgi:hypothetical protein